jgi:hypothetical protein
MDEAKNAAVNLRWELLKGLTELERKLEEDEVGAAVALLGELIAMQPRQEATGEEA